nr:hypothetical protein [Tanacetum cinerariifolium]
MIHTVETDIVKPVVEIESFGMGFDELDKEIVSVDELQLGQADRSCVHALNKLHLYDIRVVPRFRSYASRSQTGESQSRQSTNEIILDDLLALDSIVRFDFE